MHFHRCIKVGVIGFDILKWHCEDLSSYQTITLLLQSERLNKLRFTPLSTTVYLSHLTSSTPTHNLSSNRFQKCFRNKGCFIFFTRDWKKNNKKLSPIFEIGNDVLIYINIKRVFQILFTHTASQTLKCLNTIEHDS